MHELDLIPDDYRQMQKLRVHLKVFIVLFILLLLTIGTGKFILSDQLAQIKNQISNFESDKNTLEHQHQTLVQLQASKKALQNRVQILRKLRDGPPARQMFVVMDKVLDKGTWFSRWSFMRAGEFRELEPDTVNTGYFVIVQDNKKQKQERAWKLNTHMELDGQALDHTYLATFVNRLIQQPEIEDVKVLKTSTHTLNKVDIVDFSLAVTVNNNYGY